MGASSSPFAAPEQWLGYTYQARLALLNVLSLPESTAVLIETEDDVEFISEAGRKSLASLKHKAEGDRLTNLSEDFWKSIRVWLAHYLGDGRISSESRFLLFTTASVSAGSFLTLFADGAAADEDRAQAAREALGTSRSQLIGVVRRELEQLKEDEQRDFFSRVTIIDATPRITNIPGIIHQYLRTVRRESREAVFERLEGWWMDLVIKLLAGERKDPVYGHEVSDKLSFIAEEYRTDNLPITFRNRLPDGQIDVASDSRLFVEQLRMLHLSPTRLQTAIIDYYRAFEQRSSWARESLLVSGEIEEYEDRLVEEWTRYREIVFETITEASDDEACLVAGKELYRWAEMETSMLRIRERVTEPFVVRGAFHILANSSPNPRVYWHPRFLQRLKKLLGIAA